MRHMLAIHALPMYAGSVLRNQHGADGMNSAMAIKNTPFFALTVAASCGIFSARTEGEAVSIGVATIASNGNHLLIGRTGKGYTNEHFNAWR